MSCHRSGDRDLGATVSARALRPRLVSSLPNFHNASHGLGSVQVLTLLLANSSARHASRSSTGCIPGADSLHVTIHADAAVQLLGKGNAASPHPRRVRVTSPSPRWSLSTACPSRGEYPALTQASFTLQEPRHTARRSAACICTPVCSTTTETGGSSEKGDILSAVAIAYL